MLHGQEKFCQRRATGETPWHRPQANPSGATGRGSAMLPSLPMGADVLVNTIKGNASLDQGGGSLRSSQRGGLKDAAANRGACILDLPGDLEIGGQESGVPEGTAIKHKGV